MTNPPDVFIAGDGMYLRGLTARDLDGNWYRWFNDPEVTYYQDKGYVPNTRELQARYYERMTTSTTDVLLAIVDAGSQRHVGNVGLHDIKWIHRTAMLGIVIGEKEYWGRGFGRQAWALITRHGFETLNLSKIWAMVVEGNDRSLACAKHAGFEVEGRQRQQMYKRGAYHDLILVGVTRAAWSSTARG